MAEASKAKKTTTKKAADKSKAVKKVVKTAEKKVAPKLTKQIEELVETELIAEAIVDAEKEIDREETKVTAKAGKRSSKSLKEAEEKQAKEERKAHADINEETPKVKPAQKPARSKLERRGKKFRKAAQQLEIDKEYSLKDALELVIKTSPVKFDASVEMHINLGVDPRQAEQNIRETVVLPSGTGKSIKIAVLADVDDAAKAKKAGADKAGNEELLAELDKGVIDFDVLIATPALMAKLGKYARVLGPKGLMPNPKSGTVTPDVAKAVTEAKAGRVEFRVDSTGIVHLAVGKVSFGAEKLDKNVQAVFASVRAAKPATLKGVYIKNVHLASTMGPSIKVLLSDVN